MSTLLALSLVPILFLVGLAQPVAAKEHSAKAFLRAFVLSFFGVLLPLFIFLASGFLLPEWKGGCPHGWIDCFHGGKLALTPFVLWAVEALYALDIYRVETVTNGIAGGVFIGAIISVVCLGLGLFIAQDGTAWCMLVPGYISVWLVVRAFQLIRTGKLKPRTALQALLGSLPFWVGGIFWMQRVYASLPDSRPGCFIVTAATRGHRWLVGPFLMFDPPELRQVNGQLATLWRFEARWRLSSPISHAAFRRFYNWFGPIIARRIHSSWMADLVYLAVKPMELLARFWLFLDGDRDSAFR